MSDATFNLPDEAARAVREANEAVVNAKPGGKFGPPIACGPADHVFLDDAETCSACGLTPAEAADLDHNT